MNEYLKLAWRNIWRNKRRTLITTASIFFAVFFALIMRSFQLGTYDKMIYSIIESYSGFIQVQSKDYLDEPIMDNAIPFDTNLETQILKTENIKAVIPRLQSFGMASFGEKSKTAIIIGINPEKEKLVNNLEKRIVKIKLTEEKLKQIENNTDFSSEIIEKIKTLKGNSYYSTEDLLFDIKLNNEEQQKYLSAIETFFNYEGQYLNETQNQILVSYKLAEYLDINVGDSLVIVSQGYHGVSAAGVYYVCGLLKLSNPEFNNAMIYMPLKTSQNLFSAYEISDNLDTTFLVSYLSLCVKNKKDKSLLKSIENIKNNIDTKIYNVLYWKEYNKQLVQQIKGDNISGQAMLGLLYLIIGFGVFGTVLMMTAERKREFGVMIAVGMQRFKLKLIVTIEMIIIGAIGILAGILASAPIVLLGYWFPIRLTGERAKMMKNYNLEPIMPMAWFDMYYVNQTIVVMIIVLIAAIYPIYRIGKLNIINALRA